ncbi:acyltransferase family protein [Solwaraspora sp. WMMD937]|uniref:acyltransferase family protein n=1 Tax=Solwaraspora sp. WMMD937 TaxID=3016090 RepID=UPI00249BE3E5|nr:acyltransferase family protein [Solwaraspora sp. WMMD937]WFE20755.1 acyltransferase family protein [Solwaraspora sp. WMMD937]
MNRPQTTVNRPQTELAATSQREPVVDLIRALAVVGVVAGHWWVTAVVLTDDGVLQTASPLTDMPWLSPLTWLAQTLGLLFFAAGFAAARSSNPAGRAGGLRTPGGLRALRGPLTGLAGGLALALVVGYLAGAPTGSLVTVATLTVSPLWFLVVLLVLRAVSGPLLRGVRQGPERALVIVTPLVTAALTVVTAADLGHLPPVLAVFAAWLMPFLAGLLMAEYGPPPARCAVGLLVGGVVVLTVLTVVGGYPASAVGVPGQVRSNLNPPSLATLALVAAQVGAAGLAVRWLRGRIDTTARWWSVVAAVNRHALGVYLWHQPVLVGLTVAALWLAGGTAVAGVHTAPEHPGWLVDRAVYLPVLAVALITLRRIVPTRRPGCTLLPGSTAGRPVEVIAVRDSDPPSRRRATGRAR